jgi:uncharacterized membrane protein (DUF485 family)
MSNKENAGPWSVTYQKASFHALARRRRTIVVQLFVLSALFYFSLPFMTTVFPEFFRIKVLGSINIGLIYAILQYPIGGLIAYRYAVSMRKVDRLVDDI